MNNVIIYSTEYCPYCDKAKELLTSKNIAYKEIRVDSDPAKLKEMMEKSQRRSVPQIFINDHHVGGFDDLAALVKEGKLDDLLNK